MLKRYLALGAVVLLLVGCGGRGDIGEQESGFAEVTFAATSAAGFGFSVSGQRTAGPPCGLDETLQINCALLDANGEASTTDPVCTGTWDLSDMFLWVDDTTNCPTGSDFAFCDDLNGVTLVDGVNTLQITCHSNAQATFTFDVDLDP